MKGARAGSGGRLELSFWAEHATRETLPLEPMRIS